MLKASLSGKKSLAIMIACLSPFDRDLEENIQTLKYAWLASYL